MKEKNNNKKHTVIGLSVVLLVTLTLLGLTYAYYKTRLVTNSNTTSVSVTSKLLQVTYKDGSSSVVADKKISPGDVITKEFSVENTGDEKTSYGIVLDKINNGFTRQQDWTYVLKKGEGDEAKEIASGQIGDTSEEPQYIYLKDTVDKGSENKYKLVVTYAKLDTTDQSEDMGKTLTFRVNIADAKTVFDEAEPGTLLNSIGESVKNTEEETSPTIPGQAVNRADEAYIGETEDDYGTSYYYRGNVTNNFLNFGGMCWRIVRVQGNGAIKIVLADGANSCNDEGYSLDATTSAFIATSQQYDADYSSKENVKYNQSDIPSVISNWLEQQKIAENQYIDTEAEWCMDVSETDDYIYFGPRDRLYPTTSAAPSLRCDFEGENGTHSEKYIGGSALLSSDEVAFAGAVYSSSNSNYYLNKNASGGWWWTLSPAYFYSGDAFVFGVGSSGILIGYYVYSTNGSVRPAVVLKSTTPIKADEADGTKDHPYVIE